MRIYIGFNHERLTVLSRVGTNKRGEATWNVSCSCGNKKTMPSRNIKRSKSCGCLAKELSSKRIIDRTILFWDRVVEDKKTGCLNWTGSKNQAGYGTLRKKGVDHYTHRFAYELKVGEIPKGKFVCHKCDNKKCCNPKHLFLGSHKDNMADMTKKHRQAVEEKNGNSKVTKVQVKQIRKLNKLNVSICKIAETFSISRSQVYNIIKKISWKNIVD